MLRTAHSKGTHGNCTAYTRYRILTQYTKYTEYTRGYNADRRNTQNTPENKRRHTKEVVTLYTLLFPFSYDAGPCLRDQVIK